ncbi:MAG: helix-turn-helix domain-containing protein [Thermoleophilaceae bacterium]|nr:helix-turn-helix domain-containing protein [Thermoleophilaceae bacterium]
MDRDSLRLLLDQGLSFEEIGRRFGRDPSTVAYWARKFGLMSSHAERHAARGGIPRDTLEPLVAAGHSMDALAAELGVSVSTVRHWLKRHGLETIAARRRRERGTTEALAGDVQLQCHKHGLTTFRLRSDGGSPRCLKCRSAAVSDRRRRVKAILVSEAGGACIICGYDRFPGALQFHHLDPTVKAFPVSRSGVTRSIAEARVEAAKCALLCANCHAEVEAGVTDLPLELRSVARAVRGSAIRGGEIGSRA